jgi:8-oxo-dGTP pyrophosphatase MutT (NUDIX family)
VTGPSTGPGPRIADELVEVVDERGEVLETVSRAEMRRRNLRHRTVFIAVTDPAGERLLVHRRAEWKETAPGWWDVAFGGVVTAGEGWDEAAARELAEEAGVHAPLEPTGEGTYDDGEVSEVYRSYLARSEGPFRFADGEVTEVEWVALDALPAWLEGRPVCPDSVAAVLPHLAGRA